MTIMRRIIRLCRADIHDVVDQMENKGLLLKQYLRDMERELGRKESILNKMMVSRDQAKGQYERFYSQTKNLEQDLTIAVERGEDNIARRLMKKLRPLSHHLEETGRYIETLDKGIGRYKECLKGQQSKHERLRLRCLEYTRGLERSKWEKSIGFMIPGEILEEPSDAEIEIELLKRRAAIKGSEDK